jgi:hypothetical protein
MANGLTCFTYVLTIFLFDLSCYTNVECTPRGPLPFTPLLHLERGRLCPPLGCTPLYPFLISCFIFIGLILQYSRTTDRGGVA